LHEHRKVIIHSPTGGGKSFIAKTIKDRSIAKGNTVLVLSESREIFRQLKKEMEGVRIDANVKFLTISHAQCYVGMIQTLKNRPLILRQLQELGNKLIVLIDECHISISRDIIDGLPEAYIGGLTATPFGLQHKHLPELYNELVEGPQVDYLIQNKFLCTYKHIARSRADLSLLEMRNGDYTEKSQDDVFGSSVLYDGLKDDLKIVPYKKCVIFVASIKQADALNAELQSYGFNSIAYHSKIENAAFELAKFTELNLADIIVTIKSLSKGWDYPPVDLVVLMHKTTSPSLYLQEIGRGARVIPGEKYFFTVLDYGDNWRQHGLYWDDRDYSTLWKEVKKPKQREELGIMTSAMCDNCEAIIAASLRLCPYCGHERQRTEKELEQGRLIDITASYQDLVGRNISELTPQQLSVYAKIKKKQPFAARVARAKQQEDSTFLPQFANHMGYKSGWVDHQLKMIGINKINYADITLR
jgi:superfamily II DNA or RNA helicase